MSKTYLTKTGIPLICIQGEGLGDGIPSMRGMLRVITDEEARNFEIRMFIDRFKDRKPAMEALKNQDIKAFLTSKIEFLQGRILSNLSEFQKLFLDQKDPYLWASQVKDLHGTNDHELAGLCDDLMGLIDENFFTLYSDDSDTDEGA
jgi:hypothetical protein